MARAVPSGRIYVLPGAKWSWEVHHSTIGHLTGNPDGSAKCVTAAVQVTHTFVRSFLLIHLKFWHSQLFLEWGAPRFEFTVAGLAERLFQGGVSHRRRAAVRRTPLWGTRAPRRWGSPLVSLLCPQPPG